MSELEACIVLENQGWDKDSVDDIMDAYRAYARHIGWQDKRRDKRSVVKFHDIFYYTPEFPERDDIFNQFCEDTAFYVEQTVDDYTALTTRQTVGNYPALVLYTPEITQDNILELAIHAYEEFPYNTQQYIEDHITLVDAMQTLEDTYLDEWIDFLRINGYEDIATQTEHNIATKG